MPEWQGRRRPRDKTSTGGSDEPGGETFGAELPPALEVGQVTAELLDGQLLAPFDSELWGRELREQLAATTMAGLPGAGAGEADAPDVERQMDAMREAHHAAVFRLLAQDLEGKLTANA